MKTNLLKAVFIAVLILSTNIFVQAQVRVGSGNGSVNNQNVLLELNAPNKALLLTRVYNPTTTITPAYRGMIVFDSSANKLAYYNGTAWVYPADSTQFYRQGGNSFGTAGILGTKDNNSLNFMTNNTNRITIGADGHIGIGRAPNNSSHVTVQGLLQADVIDAPALNGINLLGATNITILRIPQILYLNSGLPIGSIDRDEILVVDTTLQRQVKKIPASSFKTIYNADGTLTGNRTVNMGGRSLYFTNSGNIGIGTINPTQKLTMGDVGNNPIGSPQSVAISLGSTFYDDGSGNLIGKKLKLYLLETTNKQWGFGVSSNSLDYIVPENVSHVFYTDNTERMRISGNGNVSMNGNVGIGTASPAYKLDVNGDLKGNTVYTSQIQGISDARLKKEVSPIQGALAKILQLQGVTYTWRKDMEQQAGYIFKTGMDYGVIAQDIQKILPELVQKDAKGFLTVDYVHITPVLIEAIKEQQKQIIDQQNQINELRNMIQQLLRDKK